MDKVLETVSTEDIWEQFNVPLRGFVKKRVSNDPDVDDILQDIFCSIHKNIVNLREKEKIRAWIYTIAKNSVTDFYRNHDKEKVFTELSDEIVDDSVAESIENNEIANCLKVMINYLPEKYREAILLTEFENFTQKELGERLGLSQSGAKSRVQRARTKLKDMLIGCCQLEFDRLGNIIDYKQRCKDCKYC